MRAEKSTRVRRPVAGLIARDADPRSDPLLQVDAIGAGQGLSRQPHEGFRMCVAQWAVGHFLKCKLMAVSTTFFFGVFLYFLGVGLGFRLSFRKLLGRS